MRAGTAWLGPWPIRYRRDVDTGSGTGLTSCPETPDDRWSLTVTKRTFQPNNRRRAKTHGFRLRMRTRAGRAIIAARRRKGRSELSA